MNLKNGALMSEIKDAVTAEVKIEDAVIHITAKADLIEVLRDLAKKSDNTIDDALVEMVNMARQNLDWKGYAKGVL
jgi:D-alanyl-D-alanine carboxypeptidase